MPSDCEADAARKRAADDAAMNASKINYAELLFLPLILLADAVAVLLPFLGAAVSVLAAWVAIFVAVLVLIGLLTSHPRR